MIRSSVALGALASDKFLATSAKGEFASGVAVCGTKVTVTLSQSGRMRQGCATCLSRNASSARLPFQRMAPVSI